MKNYWAKVKKYFADWSIVDWLWTITSTLVLTVACVLVWDSYNHFMSVMYLVGTVTGIWNVILVAKCKTVGNVVAGTVNCICLGIVYISWDLLGNAFLYLLFYIPMLYVQMAFWFKNKTSSGQIKTRFLKRKGYLLFGGIILVASVIFGYFLSLATPETPILGEFLTEGNPLPYFDALLTVASIVAMFMLVFLYIEQWWTWLVIDSLSIIMWVVLAVTIKPDLAIPMIIMFTCWTISAFHGTIRWYQNTKKVKQELASTGAK